MEALVKNVRPMLLRRHLVRVEESKRACHVRLLGIGREVDQVALPDEGEGSVVEDEPVPEVAGVRVEQRDATASPGLEVDETVPPGGFQQLAAPRLDLSRNVERHRTNTPHVRWWSISSRVSICRFHSSKTAYSNSPTLLYRDVA